MKPQYVSGRGRGFARAGRLVEARVREAGASRGFAVTRLLTHWAEIAGQEIAAIARPVEVSYGRSGMGATLTLLTTGAHAPILEMQKERLRERVNATYGYAAISRIRITQTAPTGFAEGQADFAPAPVKPAKRRPHQPVGERRARAAQVVEGVENEALKTALETLGANILARRNS